MVQTVGRAAPLRLGKLLAETQFIGARDIAVQSCCCDSRRVQPGDLFAALPGSEHDGHEFAFEALRRGASAFLLERPLPLAGKPACIVPDVREAYGRVCHALAGDPSAQVKVLGITGTNGKTTTTQLTAAILRAAGVRVGTIGTLGICDGERTAPASLTTPPPTVLARWLARMAAVGCSHAVMEVSSHALAQARLAGMQLDAACFTNIRRDHLDFHGSLFNYRRIKARLLDYLSPDGVAVANVDDPPCAALLAKIHHPVVTVGMSAEADITATLVEQSRGEQTFLLSAGNDTAAVRTRMIGEHHVANCLVAAALGVAYGIDLVTIARGLESVDCVPGRLERIDCGQPFGVFVDYAHTPDALVTVLAALRRVTTGRLLCIFGAGGDRDRSKRPLMGAAVERGADVAVLTTDNPRGEDPADIARHVQKGFQRPAAVVELADRQEAIVWALAQARPGDTVLIAGKGHEDYQIIGAQRYWFDDRQVARDALYGMAGQETCPTAAGRG